MLQRCQLLALSIIGLASFTDAHQSIYHPAAFGMNVNNPFSPIGPGLQFSDWWMRGPAARADKPSKKDVVLLPVGKSTKLEIACHVAWTSMSGNTENNVACPNSVGAYHNSIDPSVFDPEGITACSLGIADVEHIEDVTMDNLAIFSTNRNCVNARDTYFEIPAAMPQCSGPNCICAWFWLPKFGQANFYMTPFQCNVTGALPNMPKIAPPQDPLLCKGPNGEDIGVPCVAGSKRPLYAYNNPTNVPWFENPNRPAYRDHWSFEFDGAQNDIFMSSSSGAVSSIMNATSGSTSTSISTNLPTAASAPAASVISVASSVLNVASSSLAPSSATPVLTAPIVAIPIALPFQLPSIAASSEDAASTTTISPTASATTVVALADSTTASTSTLSSSTSIATVSNASTIVASLSVSSSVTSTAAAPLSTASIITTIPLAPTPVATSSAILASAISSNTISESPGPSASSPPATTASLSTSSSVVPPVLSSSASPPSAIAASAIVPNQSDRSSTLNPVTTASTKSSARSSSPVNLSASTNKTQAPAGTPAAIMPSKSSTSTNTITAATHSSSSITTLTPTAIVSSTPIVRSTSSSTSKASIQALIPGLPIGKVPKKLSATLNLLRTTGGSRNKNTPLRATIKSALKNKGVDFDAIGRTVRTLPDLKVSLFRRQINLDEVKDPNFLQIDRDEFTN